MASQLEISNGHAARMRYSRFRQQMEGIASTPRSSRPRKTSSKPKTTGKASAVEDTAPCQPQPVVKQESQTPNREADFFIKADPYAQGYLNLADIPLYSSQSQTHPGPSEPSTATCPSTSNPGHFSMFSHAPSFGDPTVAYDRAGTQHVWTPVKTEPGTRDEMNDIFIKSDPSMEQEAGAGDNKMDLNSLAAESRVSKVEDE